LLSRITTYAMENKKDIGKAFRDKLSALEDTPSDGLWQAIEADLDKKKKRRFLPFWITLFTAMVLGISALVYNGSTTADSEGFIDLGTGTVQSGRATVDSSANQTDDTGWTKKNDNRPNDNNKDGHVDGNTLHPSYDHQHYENSGDATKPHHGIANQNDIKKKQPNQSTAGLAVGSGNALDENATHPNNKTKQKRNFTKGQSDTNTAFAYTEKSKKGKDKRTNPNDANQTTTNRVYATESNHPTDTNNGIASADGKTSTDGLPANGSSTNATPTDTAKTDSLKTNPNQKILTKEPVAELPNPVQKDSTKSKNNPLEKVSIFLYASPTMGGYTSDKSPFDKRLNSNPKKFEPTLSYGAYGIYEATESWSLRFGISIMNLRMVTQDAVVNTSDYDYIDYTKNTNVSLSAQSNAKTMDIIQEISYTEVPLELKYAIRRRKFGVNAYGGLSALFIGKNVVAGIIDGKRYEIGKTKMLASNSYTLLAGIGVDYKFSKSIRLNVEPVFKYHLLDYKDVGVRPYSIGMMTGLQFSFQ
jgi:hypothetical protein